MTDAAPAPNNDVTVSIPLDKIPKGFLYRFDAWGKPFWNVMHSITFSYPDNPTDDEKERIRTFFKIIPYYLPCSICGVNLVKEMAETPLSDEVLKNMNSLSRWMVDLHNSVNVRLKKPTVTYEAAKRYYFEDASTDPRGPPPPPSPLVKPPTGTNPLYKTAFWSVSVIMVVLLLIVVALIIVPKFLKA
jgi:hypothetical protein